MSSLNLGLMQSGWFHDTEILLAPELERCLGHECFNALLAESLCRHLGVDTLPGQSTGPLLLTDDEFRHHSFVVGAIGHGKTQLTRRVVDWHLRNGCSVVVFCAKFTDLAQMYRDCSQATERVTVLSPDAGRFPGWNPLLVDVPVHNLVNDTAEVLFSGYNTATMPRAFDLLKNLLYIVAERKLSFVEMFRFLTRDMYQPFILDWEPQSTAAAEAMRYFATQFPDMQRNIAETVGAITNKMRDLMNSDFLKGTLCANKNDLDLNDLWETPQAVLVQLDSSQITTTGAGVLGGLLARHLLNTAQRRTTPGNPVMLAIDELGDLIPYLSADMNRTAIIARAANLRLFFCCQFRGQLPTQVAGAMEGVQCKFNFRSGPKDATAVASNVLLTSDTQPKTILVKEAAGSYRDKFWICDYEGNGIRIPAGLEPTYKHRELIGNSLKRFLGDIYVANEKYGTLEPLENFVVSWRFRGDVVEVAEDGRLYAELGVSRPEFAKTVDYSNSERGVWWEKRVTSLDKGECVAIVDGKLKGIAKIDMLPLAEHLPDHRSYDGMGRPPHEVKAEMDDRDRAVDIIAAAIEEQINRVAAKERAKRRKPEESPAPPKPRRKNADGSLS